MGESGRSYRKSVVLLKTEKVFDVSLIQQIPQYSKEYPQEIMDRLQSVVSMNAEVDSWVESGQFQNKLAGLRFQDDFFSKKIQEIEAYISNKDSTLSQKIAEKLEEL